MTDDMHPCAAEHCTTQIPRHLLMCPGDWALVPRAIQGRVVRTYQNLSRDGWGPYADAIADARQAVAQAQGGKK
ncbi:hypothetical protein GCM10017673_37700 [Streptosporangium violaceochromogenes]|nr:hypothetical protein GCM10017673_37700 [Streptosporangium violaceochromogenes]